MFLSTVHSVKGLEFDHVFILDGSWSNKKGDEAEEERRLFYVAMSRARETLTLFSKHNTVNPHCNLPHGEFMLTRSSEFSGITPKSIFEYILLGMDDLFIDFAGMRNENHPSRKAIEALKFGEKISFKHSGDTIELVNKSGVSVGRLSKNAKNKWSNSLMEVEEAKVVAVVRRYKEDNSDEAQKERCRGDRWEVPLVEVKKRLFNRSNFSPVTLNEIKSPEELPRKKNKKKKKLSLSQRQNNNIQDGKPKNAGLPWSGKARVHLANEFEKNKSVKFLAEMFERTEKAIIAELVKQGLVEQQGRSVWEKKSSVVD